MTRAAAPSGTARRGAVCGAIALFLYTGCHDRDGSTLPQGGTSAVVVAEPPPRGPRAALSAVASTTPPEPPGTTTAAGAASEAPVSGKGLLRRPWLSLTRADLEAAVQQAGYQVGQFSESDASNGRLLRIVKVSKGAFQGSVAWYKTDDIEDVKTSFVRGAPHRVEGGVLLTVKPADPAWQAEAQSLLDALAGR